MLLSPPSDSTSALTYSIKRYDVLLRTTTIDDCDAMQFWRQRKNTDSQLHSIACVLYAAAPTQVSLERAFSGLSFILNPQRTNIGDVKLGDIMLISQIVIYLKNAIYIRMDIPFSN